MVTGFFGKNTGGLIGLVDDCVVFFGGTPFSVGSWVSSLVGDAGMLTIGARVLAAIRKLIATAAACLISASEGGNGGIPGELALKFWPALFLSAITGAAGVIGDAALALPPPPPSLMVTIGPVMDTPEAFPCPCTDQQKTPIR